MENENADKPNDSAIVQAFALGYSEGMGDLGMTYDGSPYSPRSMAYDYGRTLRRSVEGIDDGGEDSKATRIRELEGALRALEWRAENHVAALVTIGCDPGKLSAACENARRVLGGGK